MDDDLTFGASVWGAAEPVSSLPPQKELSPIPLSESTDANAFDEFDDFGPPAHTDSEALDEDDFGDFGDFGGVEESDMTPAEFGDDMGSFSQQEFTSPIAGPSSYASWEPLRLDPMPARAELEEEIQEILAPLWVDEHIDEFTTDDGIREMEGVSQILVTPTSRDLYNTLTQSPPPTKPPNWIRSRIRRQHLISLGIPVNLDEVLPPHANGKALPTLQVTTRPMSAPPGPRHSPSIAAASTSQSRAGSPRPSPNGNGRTPPTSQFGPKPQLNEAKINSLLELDSTTLTLRPLPVLERTLADLRAQTAETSALLTHLLQARDALQQDSETYNGLIAELVGEAQKIKTGVGRKASRRGSGMS